MSIERIDHIVIAVRDLEQAISDYRALGFTVYPGGEHPGGYSHNALVIFADGSYFELIAFKRERPGWRWWDLLQSEGEGLIDYALLPNAVEQDYAAVQGRGLALEVLDGGRTRLDGQQLIWKTARSQTNDLPFLCGDVTPRVLRVPDGEVRQHANGVIGIASITIAVQDLALSVERYQLLLNIPPLAQPAIAGLGAESAVFQLGNAHVILACPSNAESLGSATQTLRTLLDRRGEGPYAVGLFTTQAAQVGVLDTTLSHHARLELIGQH
jgi:catechol 2,3-dioxygenase-like lactoylglutathione lyase family enzyme